jgi:hypothetical protein
LQGPQGWTDERVIVFTEYRDTQTWLAGLLTARGLSDDRLGMLYGGLGDARRHQLKRAFQASPNRRARDRPPCGPARAHLRPRCPSERDFKIFFGART